MDEGTLLWGLLFGSIGIGYFMYGRRQRRVMPFVAGLGLMVFPYFVEGTLPVVVVGALLMASTFVFRV